MLKDAAPAADEKGMSYRIAGFSDSGEARLVDRHGRVVGYGELVLENAHLSGIESGDLFGLSLRVTWTPELPDPDALDIDWDGLLS